MIFLSSGLVILRFVQRATLVRDQRRFWWDDWLILTALLCAYGTLGSRIPDIYTGYHNAEDPVEDLIDYNKVMAAMDRMNLPT